jgi:hypothetical protein
MGYVLPSRRQRTASDRYSNEIGQNNARIKEGKVGAKRSLLTSQVPMQWSWYRGPLKRAYVSTFALFFREDEPCIITDIIV